MGRPHAIQALGWEVLGDAPDEITFHNGGTGGYRSYVAFDPRRRVGVVVLTNAESVVGADDIGAYLMSGTPVAPLTPPLAPPPSSGPHHAIAVDPKVLAGYVGRYRWTSQSVVEITLENGHLFAQWTGEAKSEVFPERPDRVFWKVVDAQMDFEVDPGGRATSLTLHQDGLDNRAPRVVE
jgi:hypothetical protein